MPYPATPKPPGATIPTAQISRQILYKLRDLNLSAERILLSDGGRIEFRGCLDPAAPVRESVAYRLTFNQSQERLLAISLAEGRLCLALSSERNQTIERSRYLNLIADDQGYVSAPQLRASINPRAARAEEVTDFLQSLALACLPTSIPA